MLRGRGARVDGPDPPAGPAPLGTARLSAYRIASGPANVTAAATGPGAETGPGAVAGPGRSVAGPGASAAGSGVQRTSAPAALASRPASSAASHRQASSQLPAAASGVPSGAVTVVPRSALLAAQPGPAWLIRAASRPSASGPTVTDRYPRPVTAARQIPAAAPTPGSRAASTAAM